MKRGGQGTGVGGQSRLLETVPALCPLSPMKDHLIIGSRGSKLALWQAEWVRARLSTLDSGVEIRIEIIKTSGDVMRDVPLAIIGGQGVFTKEIEQSLLAGHIDIAVHSLKDLPTVIPEGLAITAVPEREDPRDALVLRAGLTLVHSTLSGLPAGATVGTSSLRRIAQLKHRRPDVLVKDLRGNVDTRLRKLDAGGYDAVILAAAGLRRLGLERRINASISIGDMLPAVGQGALGIETRADDEQTNALVSRLDRTQTHAAVVSERALLRQLGGGCQIPIAAHAVAHDEVLHLDAVVVSLSGEQYISDAASGNTSQAEILGQMLAESLLAKGAGSILSALPEQFKQN